MTTHTHTPTLVTRIGIFNEQQEPDGLCIHVQKKRRKAGGPKKKRSTTIDQLSVDLSSLSCFIDAGTEYAYDDCGVDVEVAAAFG